MFLNELVGLKPAPDLIFSNSLNKEQIEAIRAYVIAEANSDRDTEFYENIDQAE